MINANNDEVNVMKTVGFVVDGLTCPSCSRHVETLLRRELGVEKVQILFTMGKIMVEYNESLTFPSALQRIIERAGYRAREGAAS